MRKRKAGQESGGPHTAVDINTLDSWHGTEYLDNVLPLRGKRMGSYVAPEWFEGVTGPGVTAPMPVPLFAIADRQKQRVLRRQRIVLAGAAFAAGAALAHTMGRYRG